MPFNQCQFSIICIRGVVLNIKKRGKLMTTKPYFNLIFTPLLAPQIMVRYSLVLDYDGVYNLKHTYFSNNCTVPYIVFTKNTVGLQTYPCKTLSSQKYE